MAFEVLQIQPKDAQSYVERYKSFRLHSLLTSPEAFHSTYEREIAFTDNLWLERLSHPNNGTFVALQSGKIVCTLTLVGPLDYAPDDLYPSTNPSEAMQAIGGSPQPFSHWRNNGMFTLPEARGQGIAQTLIKMAQEYGVARAAASGKDFIGTIVTESYNIAARSLYEKCGFVPIKEQPSSVPGEDAKVIIMQFPPRDPGRGMSSVR